MSDDVIDEVRLEIADGVARVTIDRPAVLNAVDKRSTDRLEEYWSRIESDRSVRVVVITGSGDRSFSVGADLRDAQANANGLEAWSQFSENGFGGLSLRDTLPVPVIARVNGYAFGGGMEMVLGCDIVIAAEHAQFGLTEPRVGQTPCDGGAVQLVRRVSHTNAMGLLLTGRRAPAEEMFRMGLVNEVVPAAELDAAVDRWVADVLACSPMSLRAIKEIVRRGAGLSARDAHQLRIPALIEALDSDDSREGRDAFLEKRAPLWTGR